MFFYFNKHSSLALAIFISCALSQLSGMKDKDQKSMQQFEENIHDTQEVLQGIKSADNLIAAIICLLDQNVKKHSLSSKTIGQLLRKNKIDVNQQDSSGRSALHLAAYYGNGAAARALLFADADVDIKDNDGRTPLHYATSQQHFKFIIILLMARARMDIEDNDGKTPFDVSPSREQLPSKL